MATLALGIMSGTSADGVSIALGSFGATFKLLGYRTYSYPPALVQRLRRGARLTAPEISRLNMALGSFFGGRARRFLKEARMSPSRVAVIGSHGHTLYHGPGDRPPNTLQIGEPSAIAEAAGIPVVADFRPRDIAAGGEGAPLVPFFDQSFFGRGPARAMQNIGGIANVTLVGKNLRPVAFDTGPGNCLIDWAVRRMTRGKMDWDGGGRLAARGKILLRPIREMARHPYFRKRPPKSTGRELFNEELIPRSLLKERGENIVATLTFFTALTIVRSYDDFLPRRPREIIVSGGGALNRTLMKYLTWLAGSMGVRSIEEFGIPAQAKEPLAFGFLALRALEGKINHLPECTGARGPRILGKIIPAGRRRGNA